MVHMEFKLTYSTMFDPPAALHERFETALARVRKQLGRVHEHYIDGANRAAAITREGRSPIQRDWVLGHFPEATNAEVDAGDGGGPARVPRVASHAAS